MQSVSKASFLLNNSPITWITHSNVKTKPASPQNKQKNESIYHLNLNSFKLFPCKINESHNQKQCPFYHNAQDRRRKGDFYSENLCDYIKNSKFCPLNDACKFSHNQVEQLYRPEKYKAKFCYFYPLDLIHCEYGEFCSFAHSENEITTPLIHNYEYDVDFYLFHYKTVYCPYNLSQHIKSLCVYAHNWQDFRRSPALYDYEPVSCENWNPNDHIIDYEKGCNLEFKCKKCHGWKEAEYHPLNYKTKKCPNEKNCRRNQDCPHYHYPEEHRILSTLILYKIIKIVPQNRIINNVFKIESESESYLGSLFSVEQASTNYTGRNKGKNQTELESMCFEENKGGEIEKEKEKEKSKRFSLNIDESLELGDFTRPKGQSEFTKRNPFETEDIEKQQSFDSFMSNSLQKSENNAIPCIRRISKEINQPLPFIEEHSEDNERFIINKILD